MDKERDITTFDLNEDGVMDDEELLAACVAMDKEDKEEEKAERKEKKKH